MIFLFGVPGSNGAGTNYQWAFYYESASQTYQGMHEHGGGIKEIVDGCVPQSSPARLVYRRSGLDVSLFANGKLVFTQTTSAAPDDGAGTQQIHLGQAISMLVAEALIATDAHSDSVIAEDAKHVRLT